MLMNYTIKSKRFILRPFRKGDEESLTRNINDKEVYRYTLRIPYPYKPSDAKKWIKYCAKEFKKKNRKELPFAIELYGSVIGAVGFKNIEKHKAEIGYWLGRKYWNKGIITEALKLATNFGFRKLKLKRIYAPIFTKNKASARVLEKNGYKFEGILKKNCFKDEKFFDEALYAKVR